MNPPPFQKHNPLRSRVAAPGAMLLLLLVILIIALLQHAASDTISPLILLLCALVFTWLVVAGISLASWRQAHRNKLATEDVRRIIVASTNAHLRSSKRLAAVEAQLELLTAQPQSTTNRTPARWLGPATDNSCPSSLEQERTHNNEHDHPATKRVPTQGLLN